MTNHAPSPADRVAPRHASLLTEYGEVLGNFKLLTDIRFKLLAFLPIAAAAAAALRIGDEDADSTELLGIVALSAFGLVVTIGLVAYNIRNDQLYDALVGRAAAIERDLGLPDGAFANRPMPWFQFKLGRDWRIDHRTSVALIYSASIALWFVGLTIAVAELAYRELGNGTSSPLLFKLGVFILAVALIALGAVQVEEQREARSEAMRLAARDAVAIAKDRTGGHFVPDRLKNDDEFLQACRILANPKSCPAKVDVVKRRAAYYARRDVNLGHYVRTDPQDVDVAYSNYVALLTDLPPEWVLDCASGRNPRINPAEAI